MAAVEWMTLRAAWQYDNLYLRMSFISVTVNMDNNISNVT